MEMTVVVSLAILCLLTLPVLLRQLHILEMVMVWGVVGFIQSNYFWIFGMNDHFIRIPDNSPAILASIVSAKIIVPVLCFHGFTVTLNLRHGSARLGLLMLLTGVLLAQDWLTNRLNVYIYSPEWPVWCSIVYRIVFVAITYAAWRCVRYMARKELQL